MGNYKLNGEVIDNNYFKQKFVKIVEDDALKLRIINNNQITDVYVYSVFHCGVLSCNLNRSFENQIKDWAKIRKYI